MTGIAAVATPFCTVRTVRSQRRIRHRRSLIGRIHEAHRGLTG